VILLAFFVMAGIQINSKIYVSRRVQTAPNALKTLVISEATGGFTV
jgi:hypothetical protein